MLLKKTVCVACQLSVFPYFRNSCIVLCRSWKDLPEITTFRPWSCYC